MQKIFFFILQFYTFLIKHKFCAFGTGSVIKPFLNSSNERFISIGKNVNIGSFCRITVATEFGGHIVRSKNKVRIKIGDNVDVGNNTFITANNSVEIGSHVIMSSYVFIGDHDHGYSDINKNLHEQPLSENCHVKIGDNVFLGVKSSILKNVTIGEHSVVAANSVVIKNVAAYSVVAGNPAQVIKKYDFKLKKWVSEKNHL